LWPGDTRPHALRSQHATTGRCCRHEEGNGRSPTGLAAGALRAAALLGVFALGSLVGLPNVAFSACEWLVRILPGRQAVRRPAQLPPPRTKAR